MMIVDGRGRTETALLAGEIPCPDYSSPLRPHGHARTRTVRGPDDTRLTVRPRRARCTGCRRTQIQLPASLSVRRADTVEVIGARMGRPRSTVRRWLRRVPETHAHWLYEQAVQHAFRVNPDILVRPKHWTSLLGWSLNILAGAVLAYRHRVGVDLPPWTLIGNLLSPPLRT